MVVYIWLLLLLVCFFLKNTYIRNFYNVRRKLDLSSHYWYIHPLYIQWSQGNIFGLFFVSVMDSSLQKFTDFPFLDILVELWSFGDSDNIEVEYDAEHNSQEVTCMGCSPSQSWDSKGGTEVVSSTIIPELPTHKISASWSLILLFCRLKVLHSRVLWVDTTMISLDWNLRLLTPLLWLFISLKAKKRWEWWLGWLIQTAHGKLDCTS